MASLRGKGKADKIFYRLQATTKSSSSFSLGSRVFSSCLVCNKFITALDPPPHSPIFIDRSKNKLEDIWGQNSTVLFTL